MDKRLAFRSLVEMIFNNWTALQLAVEHGMGGPQSRQVAVNFVDYVTEAFSQKALEVEEVEDILIDVLEAEFNTECEDNSPLEVARELRRIFDLCSNGDVTQLNNEAEKLQRPGTKLWLASQAVPEPEVVPDSSRSETPPPQLMETADPDGWTVVKRK